MSNRVTACRGSNSDSSSYSSSGYIRLRARLEELDFKSFQRCVWLWLGASEFRQMRFLGRNHRRGRRSTEGPDFIVQVGAETDMRIAVQVRHWKSPVTRRAVDELRGFLLRHSIGAGMIVSSSPTSKAAREAAFEFRGRPIRLVGVDRLASSMIAMDLGVKDWPFGQSIDEAFFRTLRHVSLGIARQNLTEAPRRNLQLAPQLGLLDTRRPSRIPPLVIVLSLLGLLISVLFRWPR